MAENCGVRVGQSAPPIDERTKAFIDVETEDPDYLVGAPPGAKVAVMIRRSMAGQLDGTNPGRVPAPLPPVSASVVAPDWAVMPKPLDINNYFPERAQRTAVSGAAAVQCTVGPKGDLLGCWVAAESPLGMGFGFAALKLSTVVQMKPAAKDGSPTAGRAYTLYAAFDAVMHARTANITLSSEPLGLLASTTSLPTQSSVSQGVGEQSSANLKISHPTWLPAKIEMRYPDRAQFLEQEGQATVRCALNAKLKPDHCVITQEEPAGFGFGEATIKSIMQLQASPASSQGDLVEIPMKWRLH